jgi:hypothetical protein
MARLVQSLEMCLKGREQDGANDDGDEQSSDSLTAFFMALSFFEFVL